MKHQNGFSKFKIFQLFWLMQANGNETAAKLVCRGQRLWRKDVSVVAANFEAIFRPSGGRNVAISSFVQNLLLFICAVAAFHVNAHFATTIPSYKAQCRLAADYSYVIFTAAKLVLKLKNRESYVSFTFPLSSQVTPTYNQYSSASTGNRNR